MGDVGRHAPDGREALGLHDVFVGLAQRGVAGGHGADHALELRGELADLVVVGVDGDGLEVAPGDGEGAVAEAREGAQGAQRGDGADGARVSWTA
jgi:hypothetical protein